jgi:transcriptional regulator with XRE-family HTH domain
MHTKKHNDKSRTPAKQPDESGDVSLTDDYSKIEPDVVKRFKEMVAQLHWSQAEAARQLHVSPNYVNMIFRGTRVPSRTLSQLLEEKTRSAVPNNTAIVRRIQEFLKTAGPPENHGKILDAMESLLKGMRVQSDQSQPATELAANENHEQTKNGS